MKRLDAITKHDMISEYDRERPFVVYRHFYYSFDRVVVLEFWKFVLGLRGDRRADDISALQDFLVIKDNSYHYL